MNPRDLLTVLFLSSFLLLPWAALWWYRRGTRYTYLQACCLFLTLLLVRLLWRARLPAGGLPVAASQGAVLVCNHRSSVDPFFIQVLARRPVHWMVAREYCEQGIYGWFLRDVCEVIPVRRGGVDTAATKAAIRLAQEGGLVGMFPEGRINTTDQLLMPCRPGAVLVALKARVPIIPCYLEGSPYGGTIWSPFFSAARVTLRFGRPIDLSADDAEEVDPELLQRLLMDCLRQVAALAGQPGFQPRLAGRHWKPHVGQGEDARPPQVDAPTHHGLP